MLDDVGRAIDRSGFWRVSARRPLINVHSFEVKRAFEVYKLIHVEYGAVVFLPDNGERGSDSTPYWALPPDELVALGVGIMAHV